ncbi:putative transcription factor B3-Domain family [Helianthus annuus]|nr:putative transcription factor B3-Domain family [Helianthus annuus]
MKSAKLGTTTLEARWCTDSLLVCGRATKKSLKLPAGYGDWIKTFGYPEKNAVIRTLDGRTFEVKVFNLAGDYVFYNGWFDDVTSLKLPNDSWDVCQYEEALSSFRLFHFYQDISLAPSNYFYYKPKNDFKDRDDCMYVNRLFVHHSMLNTCPSDPVLIRSVGNRKWVVRMELLDHELYITTGWSRIKEEMSITDDHLLVFEMVDFKTFDLSSVDDEVPVTFVVDNHYRLKKKWAQTHGLDRKMDLTIKDNAGQTWNVAIGKEFSQGCQRFNVTGMREFVRDKWLVFGSSFQMVFVKSKGLD